MVEFSSEVLFVTLRLILIVCCGLILAKRKTLKLGTAKTIYQMAENLYIPCLIFSNFMLTLSLQSIGRFRKKDTSNYTVKGLTFQVFDIRSWLAPILFAIAYVSLETVAALYLSGQNIENEALGSALTKIWAANKLDVMPLAFATLLEDGLNSLSQDIYPSELSNSSRAIRSFLVFALTASVLRKIIAEKYFQIDPTQMEDNQSLTPLPSQSNERGLTYYLKNIMTITAVVAIIMSCIPFIKDILTIQKGILQRVITDSAIKCGLAVPALLLIQLGALILELKPDLPSSQLKIFAILGVVKCIALPFVSLIVLQIFKFLSIIQDPVVEFMMLLCSAAPLSVTAAVADYNNKQGSKLGSLFMWQYGLSLLSTSVICYNFF